MGLTGFRTKLALHLLGGGREQVEYPAAVGARPPPGDATYDLVVVHLHLNHRVERQIELPEQ
jgi:hypothetical protein